MRERWLAEHPAGIDSSHRVVAALKINPHRPVTPESIGRADWVDKPVQPVWTRAARPQGEGPEGPESIPSTPPVMRKGRLRKEMPLSHYWQYARLEPASAALLSIQQASLPRMEPSPH